MRPVVNGLEAEYGQQIAFVNLNAADRGQGQQAFESLALPGHPAFVIFDASGAEQFRTFGVVEESALRAALEDALAP